MGAAFNTGKSKQDYGTPWEFVDAVEARFGPIAFDLAASADNARYPKYYTESDDSLSVNWHHLRGMLWLNPPYKRIGPWAKKCAIESAKGARIAMLVPASVGSNWFADHVFNKALLLRPRMSFDGKHSYPKDLLLACYGEPVGLELWKWK